MGEEPSEGSTPESDEPGTSDGTSSVDSAPDHGTEEPATADEDVGEQTAPDTDSDLGDTDEDGPDADEDGPDADEDGPDAETSPSPEESAWDPQRPYGEIDLDEANRVSTRAAPDDVGDGDAADEADDTTGPTADVGFDPEDTDNNLYKSPGRPKSDGGYADDAGTVDDEVAVPDPDEYTGIEGPESDQEMPLADHIEEMVRRLGVVLVVMAVVSGVVFPFGAEIINFLWYSVIVSNPVPAPRVYSPLALVLARLKIATLAGFIVGLPVFVYETYLFMRPGLYPKERRYYLASVPTSLVLASIGVLFAYLLVLPALFTYFLYYSEGVTVIAFGLTETFDLMVLMLGWFALTFQIPLFVMLATMMGLVSRRWLVARRLYFWGAFLGIAFLFAPDPTGMAPIIVAATMVALFEGTLFLQKWSKRGRAVFG
jgi:sec-independent protein translocase protein TatC